MASAGTSRAARSGSPYTGSVASSAAIVRSKWPLQMTSMPGTEAISAMFCTPCAVSINSTTRLSRFAAILSVTLPGPNGTTMVTRRRVLEGIGGLEQLGWQIADDIQLARVIRRQGYRIHLLKQRCLAVNDAAPRWRKHLVAGKGVKVAIQILNINRQMRSALRAINQHGHAHLVSACDNLFHRIDCAE